MKLIEKIILALLLLIITVMFILLALISFCEPSVDAFRGMI